MNAPLPIVGKRAAGTPREDRAAVRATTPPALAEVALIDGPTAAAAACMGLSRWYALVRLGEAPQPAFRAPRCTRWRLADVRAWLVRLAEQGGDPQAARNLVRNTRRASARAGEARRAAQAGA